MVAETKNRVGPPSWVQLVNGNLIKVVRFKALNLDAHSAQRAIFDETHRFKYKYIALLCRYFSIYVDFTPFFGVYFPLYQYLKYIDDVFFTFWCV